MMLSKAGLAELDARIADHTLGIQAVRVLIAMARSLDYENRVGIGGKELAADLGMWPSAVSAAIKTLVECGFVERPLWARGPYTISPHLLWQGSAKTLKRALEERAAA